MVEIEDQNYLQKFRLLLKKLEEERLQIQNDIAALNLNLQKIKDEKNQLQIDIDLNKQLKPSLFARLFFQKNAKIYQKQQNELLVEFNKYLYY